MSMGRCLKMIRTELPTTQCVSLIHLKKWGNVSSPIPFELTNMFAVAPSAAHSKLEIVLHLVWQVHALKFKDMDCVLLCYHSICRLCCLAGMFVWAFSVKKNSSNVSFFLTVPGLHCMVVFCWHMVLPQQINKNIKKKSWILIYIVQFFIFIGHIFRCWLYFLAICPSLTHEIVRLNA